MPPQRTSDTIELSIVVLAWDELDLTMRCVESIRRSTDTPYELIIVDNGSAHEAATWASDTADIAVLHDTNLGFAKGMNAGLAVATGRSIAFLNNDIVLPQNWASRLVETLRSPERRAGIVVPSVTTAGNISTVRSDTSESIHPTRPFRDLPSGVIYVMATETMRALGGWSEQYPIASAEDLDLLFTVWCNGLEVVHDERVLVDHVGSATADTRLKDKGRIWRENRQLFVDRWREISDEDVPRLDRVDESSRQARLAQARIAAWWMKRTFDSLDQLDAERATIRRAAQKPSEPEPKTQNSTRRRSRLFGRLTRGGDA
ncbi:MAG: glycosyltransferase [Actinomycetota bacterium]|nr:glycosyltransferase [Actinomycetota bacterium]